jgi:hypothetical protein
MTAFVILHYRAIDTTRSCVKSIRALAGDTQQKSHPPAAEQRREKQPRHLAARADPQPEKAAH